VTVRHVSGGIIPIVFLSGGDPIREGLVASLNRPGGNATGVNFYVAEVVAKRMQLLREMSQQRTGRRVGQREAERQPATRWAR
jgi:ABC-type uncharacterized transport system substrate-binding protein